MRSGRTRTVMALCALVLLMSCAGEDGDPQGEVRATGPGETAPPNACPQEGCRVSVAAAEQFGDELELTFEANFTPDLARNHFHVYWENFTAEQVSDDAERRFGVNQGDWVPTDENPYTTGDATSVEERAGATSICVTAGDGDHNVIDPEITDCIDVTGLVDP